MLGVGTALLQKQFAVSGIPITVLLLRPWNTKRLKWHVIIARIWQLCELPQDFFGNLGRKTENTLFILELGTNLKTHI